MEPVERSGKSVEEILKTLSREWECLPEEIRHEVVQEGSRGVMGIGAKHALIRAWPPKGAATEPVPTRERPKPEGNAPTGATAGPEADEEEDDNIGNLRYPPGQAPVRPPRPQESDPAVLERARETLEKLVRFIVPEASVVISDDESGTLDVQGETGGLLIGRRGATLDSLQFLLNKMVYREDVGSSPRIRIDVAGYRERRAEALENLAFRMAAKARSSGRPVRLEPMAAHERRIIHLALAEEPGVLTQSEGHGDHKRVVIQPEKPRGGGGGRRGGRGGANRGRGRGGGGRGRSGGGGERGPSRRQERIDEVPRDLSDEPSNIREDAWRERAAAHAGSSDEEESS